MIIYEALKKDHIEVIQLLDQLIALDDHDTQHDLLVEQIRDALIPHSRAEEAVFYNSLRSVDADSGKVLHSYKEHVEAETLLRTLQAKNGMHLEWKATAKSLKAALQHHIQEEETQIFDLARKVLTPEEAEKIGVAFEQLKPKIKEEGLIRTTIDLVSNLMPPRFAKALNRGGSHLDRH